MNTSFIVNGCLSEVLFGYQSKEFASLLDATVVWQVFSLAFLIFPLHCNTYVWQRCAKVISTVRQATTVYVFLSDHRMTIINQNPREAKQKRHDTKPLNIQTWTETISRVTPQLWEPALDTSVHSPHNNESTEMSTFTASVQTRLVQRIRKNVVKYCV